MSKIVNDELCSPEGIKSHVYWWNFPRREVAAATIDLSLLSHVQHTTLSATVAAFFSRAQRKSYLKYKVKEVECEHDFDIALHIRRHQT